MGAQATACEDLMGVAMRAARDWFRAGGDRDMTGEVGALVGVPEGTLVLGCQGTSRVEYDVVRVTLPGTAGPPAPSVDPTVRGLFSSEVVGDDDVVRVFDCPARVGAGRVEVEPRLVDGVTRGRALGTSVPSMGEVLAAAREAAGRQGKAGTRRALRVVGR